MCTGGLNAVPDRGVREVEMNKTETWKVVVSCRDVRVMVVGRLL